MEKAAALRHVDHTLLKPTATWDEIYSLCREAIENRTASVCIPPGYVKRVRQEFGGDIVICTVVGFPLGYNTTAAKAFEARSAVEDGADEIDMVVNIGRVKDGDFVFVQDEIAAIRAAVGNKVLKVIIETCYLNRDEKIAMCGAVTDAGADYIKTSTGFGAGGATLEDVRLFAAHIGPNVKIKAAGGIRTKEDLFAFLDAGCERIGTSSALKILADQKAGEY